MNTDLHKNPSRIIDLVARDQTRQEVDLQEVRDLATLQSYLETMEAHRDLRGYAICILHLEDRISVLKNEPQVNGTQFHLVDGVRTLWPVFNVMQIDVRRRQAGLEPLASYMERLSLKFPWKKSEHA